MLGVNTNVSVILDWFSVSLVASVFNVSKCQLLDMSPVAIEYCYYTIKINVAYQYNSFHL